MCDPELDVSYDGALIEASVSSSTDTVELQACSENWNLFVSTGQAAAGRWRLAEECGGQV